jgi:ribosomal protein S18 acetylase RimI-like enzyme
MMYAATAADTRFRLEVQRRTACSDTRARKVRAAFDEPRRLTVELHPIDTDGLDRLAPMWSQLYSHHIGLDDSFHIATPPNGEGASWVARRAFYEELLAERGGWITVAMEGTTDIGYAAVALRAGSLGSWQEPSRVAVLETLVVDSRQRSRGTGPALVESVRSRCRALNITQLDVEALSDNDNALAFYQRIGFKPFMTSLISTVPKDHRR